MYVQRHKILSHRYLEIDQYIILLSDQTTCQDLEIILNLLSFPHLCSNPNVQKWVGTVKEGWVITMPCTCIQFIQQNIFLKKNILYQLWQRMSNRVPPNQTLCCWLTWYCTTFRAYFHSKHSFSQNSLGCKSIWHLTLSRVTHCLICSWNLASFSLHTCINIRCHILSSSQFQPTQICPLNLNHTASQWFQVGCWLAV